MRTHTLRLCLVVAGAVGLCAVAHGAMVLEPGVDRPGQDLRPGFDLPAADPGLCMKACQDDTACQAFTYVKPGVQGPSARCWLKGGVPPAVKNDCCVSGVRAVAARAVAPMAGQAIGHETGIDRPGGNLKPGFALAAADPGLCEQACASEAACKAWTYVKPGVQGPNARCWLKAEVPPAVSNDCCTSGVRQGSPAGLTPIQLPSPQTPPGKSGAVAMEPIPMPQPAASLPGPLPMPRLPANLSQLTAPMTRATMIATLQASPGLGAALEQVAAATGTTSTGLASSATEPPPDAGPAPQPLLDLWMAPVRLSPTVAGPTYSDQGTNYFVSRTYTSGLTQHNFRQDLQAMLAQQVVYLHHGTYADVNVELPPGGGQYVIAIHAIDSYGKSVTTAGVPVVTARVFGPKSVQDVQLVPNSDKTALVGMFTDDPANQGWPGDMQFPTRHESIILRIDTGPNWVCYGGVTITRL